jgi:arsenical pump membrane protein
LAIGCDDEAMRTAVLGGVFLLLAAVATITGVLPVSSALLIAERVWPVLLFVIAITVVTELAAAAGVFSSVAEQLARWGLNRAWLLWLLVVALATTSTIFLSLDTTAVLLTPVVVLLARHVGVPPLPFAMTTIWLANSASLLLPVSNLTNLLAEHKLSGGPFDGPLGFATLMAAPAAVCVIVPSAVLFVVYRTQLLRVYKPDGAARVEDRTLFVASAVVIVLLVPALVSGVEVWIPACIAAVVLVGFFAVRKREELKFSLLPWQIVLFASGLFLVVEAANGLGLTVVLDALVGTGESTASLLRLAGVAVASANLVDNLPAYLALEPVAGSPLRLAALLIGVNAGSLITPWASLATLLWHERLASLDVDISWRRYMGLGLIVVPLTVVPAVVLLSVVH